VTVQQKDGGVMKLNRIPNSIDTLSPNDAFVKAMNKLSLDKSRPYHSIIGDRGRGDTPNSSDGVVPYWSSHLDGAESEKIVPSGHGAEHSPEAIIEVLGILHQHIASGGLVNQRRADLRTTEMRYDSPSAHCRSTSPSN
jgi:hypothetical protein